MKRKWNEIIAKILKNIVNDPNVNQYYVITSSTHGTNS